MRNCLLISIGIFFISPAFGQDSAIGTTAPLGRPANAVVTQADPSQIVNETPEALLKRTALPAASAPASGDAVIIDPSLIKRTAVKIALPSEMILETDPAHLKKESEKSPEKKR